MNDINTKCLEVFPQWLRSLDEDLSSILDAIKSEGASPDAKKILAGGINYLFKSLDLIPDGIDDIGYLDDAFVMRLAVKNALDGDIGNVESELLAKLGRMANETDLIKDLLENDLFDRLDKYTRDLKKGASRGRTAEEIVENETVFKEFAAEVAAFVKEYSSPGFSQDERNLIKLKAFLDAKLPK